MMAQETESDLDYALRLHKELNGDGVVANVRTANQVNAVLDVSVIELSDDDEPDPAKKMRRHSPLRKVETQVTFENQQAITIQRERKSRNDYYLPLINTFVDLENNQEWALVNMEANLQQMFDKLKKRYFSNWITKVNFTVSWDTANVISDGSCFKIFEPDSVVLVKTTAMVRPRIQLISVLLHILIHVYLRVCSKNAIRINHHDENFRKIMCFLNSEIQSEISASHKFLKSPDDDDFPNHWYQCTGICQTYEPFHGTVRCTTKPDESQFAWRGHEEACGGQFFKVFEMSRKLLSDEVETKYVRNVRYIFPKIRVENVKNHLKTKLQVRELFDLTVEDDVAEPQNLCDVIDLDASEYNLASPTADDFPLASDFINQPKTTFIECPFCETILGGNRMAAHFDNCRGFQQKVVFSLKARGAINK